MESLYQHRLLHTGQLHAMHTPHATRRWTQQLLAGLARHGLVETARGPCALKLWYLTETGADAVEAIPTRAEPRRRVISAAQAAGQLQAHTLAVNDVGIAFLKAARTRGDEFGPLSWRHEIAHPIGALPGRRASEQLVADALITYLVCDPDGSIALEQRFLELDRGTLPVQELVAKFARYQRLQRHTPQPPPGETPVAAWKAHYPVLPPVLVVLAHKPRKALQRRTQLAIALYQSDPDLANAHVPPISLCQLEDLTAQGPFAPIWLQAHDPTQHVDWLGHNAATPSTKARTAPSSRTPPRRAG
jgi:hypothetical protein